MRASARASSSPQARVNLYCNQCESQIGIFENEWIRLTTSYARLKDKGSHFGTDVGNRTQTVPSRGSQKRAAEGCTLSDVFCSKCSATVGQFCRRVPDESQSHLLDKYFYKLSRVFLKDSQTIQVVEPEFGFDEDGQAQRSGSERWSQTPLPKSHIFSRPRSVARRSTQPLDKPTGRRSPENDDSRFGRDDRQSAQPDSAKSSKNNEPAFQSQYQQTPSSMRYSMPPESFGMPERLLTPQPTYVPIAYAQPYMTPFPQASFRSGSVPPQPKYSQPTYIQSPYHQPPTLVYPTYPPPIMEMQTHIVQQPLQLQAVPDAASQVARIQSDEEELDENDKAIQRRTEQDGKLHEQDLKIAKLGDKIDSVLGELQQVKFSLEEIRSDMGLKRIAIGHPNDFVNNFETMVRAVRALNSHNEEMQALRAENESMKMRLENIASAMSPLRSSASSTCSGTPLSRQGASPLSLGKRKRDDNVDRRSSLLQYEVSPSDIETSDENLDNDLKSSKRRHVEDTELENHSISASKLMPAPSRVASLQSHNPPILSAIWDSGEEQDQSQMEDSLFMAGSTGVAEHSSQDEEELAQVEDSLFMPTPSNDRRPTSPSKVNVELRGVNLEDLTIVNDEANRTSEVHTSGSLDNMLENAPIDSITPTESSIPPFEDDSNIADSIDFSDDEPARRDPPAQQQEAVMTLSEAPVNDGSKPIISIGRVNSEFVVSEPVVAPQSSTQKPVSKHVTVEQGSSSCLISESQSAKQDNRPGLVSPPIAVQHAELPCLAPRPVIIGQLVPPHLVPKPVRTSQADDSLIHHATRPQSASLEPPGHHRILSIPVSIDQSNDDDERPSTATSSRSNQSEESIDSDSSVTGSESQELSSISKEGKPSGRRVTDSVLDQSARSMAPEPARRRKTSVRTPKLIDLADAFVATPETIRLKIENKGKPRVPKPKIQTTEKALNKELKALGLSEWIGKDKNDPAYKVAVDAARKQDRDTKRIQKLSEKGLNVVQNDASSVSTNVPSTAPGYVPNSIPGCAPDNLSRYLPNNLPSYLPNNLPSYLPSNLLDCLPNNLLSSVPKNVPADVAQPPTSQEEAVAIPPGRPVLETANTNLQRPTPKKRRSSTQMKAAAAKAVKASDSSTPARVMPSTKTKTSVVGPKSARVLSKPAGGKTAAQLKSSATQASKTDTPEAPSPEIAGTGMKTRRQQQAEQIRQRDRLAQETMEREEMALAK